MKDKIVSDLNALFKARAEFYAFFDTHIPKVGQTAVFDFAKMHSANATNKVAANGNLSENLNHKPNLEQIYTLFYHYDYAIRKLLPSLYKAYEIDSEKDLSKDF